MPTPKYDALKLFDCKSKEERAFYKDQLKELKKSMGNNFSVNNIKEKLELNEIIWAKKENRQPHPITITTPLKLRVKLNLHL